MLIQDRSLLRAGNHLQKERRSRPWHRFVKLLMLRGVEKKETRRAMQAVCFSGISSIILDRTIGALSSRHSGCLELGLYTKKEPLASGRRKLQ